MVFPMIYPDEWAQIAAEAPDPWKYIYALVEAGLLVQAGRGVKGPRWAYRREVED